jgi:hypothetical protein
MNNRPLYPLALYLANDAREREIAGSRGSRGDPSVKSSGSPSSTLARGWPARPHWSWPDPAEGRAGSPSQEIHHVQRRP